MEYHEQVRRVQKIVRDRWCREVYFKAVAGKLCCCVHGAAQIVCNPSVGDVFKREVAARPGEKVIVFNDTVEDMHSRAICGSITAAFEGSTLGLAGAKEAWIARPSWIKKSHSDTGNQNLHFLLGMFGITAVFNDDPSTTQETLDQRLETCAVWAKENQEFLAAN